MLTIGASPGPICGVRDYARGLDAALAAHGFSSTTLWLERGADSPARSPGGARLWIDEVRRTAELARPDCIVWHYSVFALSHRGIPVAPPLLALRLRRLGIPIVLVCHELLYPFGRRGWRGTVQAASHRAVLPLVIGTSAACVVTTDERAVWLRTRRWLPARPLVVAPVFSNLPDRPWQGGRERGVFRVGLFGFAQEATSVELAVAALAELEARGLSVRLTLIGAPGGEGAAAEGWRREAERAGCADALTFTGTLAPAALAEALATCDVALFANDAGPTSRRTTTAAALAAGVPLVAVDGPQRWQRLVAERAVAIVEPRANALADELERLWRDPALRREQGRRGRQFYRRVMAPTLVTARIASLVDGVIVPTERRLERVA